ncbi:hypothetical protein VB1_CDS0052 [Arthrobacter phage Marchesin]|nr:hypothetical protein VB1_CDS0052 [Arthrobacter phage Marchesin]
MSKREEVLDKSLAVIGQTADKSIDLMAGAVLKLLEDPTIRALLSAVDSADLRKKIIDEAAIMVKDSIQKQLKGAAVVFAAEALLQDGQDNGGE